MPNCLNALQAGLDMTDPDFTDLSKLPRWVLARLKRAATMRGDPMRWAVLATRTEDGVSARTLVLRGFEPERRELILFSDARAPKIAEIQAEPHVSLVFFDPNERVQLRAWGTARVETNTETALAWRRGLSPQAQKDYATKRPPGSAIETSLPDLMQDVPDETFAVLAIRLSHVDGLKLGGTHHQRVLVDWRTGDGAPTVNWLTP